ncbi:hypothetical protein [Metabacillus fastidiosus]|uniref:Uncharacterized protein n=1 Tax=Metabacillus fastidiosus TaxID=1458 RepID=A0ABU6NS24_9BACI|nr:hypothetical protein [Metabacillus fastidiosus]
MKPLAEQVLERMVNGEEEAKSGLLKAAVELIKRQQQEIKNLKNPQIW